MKNFHFLIIPIGLVILASGCKDNDPEPVNQEELITTLRLHFEAQGTSEHFHFEFIDIDGDGGDDPVITTSPMSANTTYSMQVEILDEAVTPVVDIGAEVREEDEEHQMFYIISASLHLTYQYEDEDANGNPLGLENTFQTGAASQGTLTVVLRHEPDKFGTGVSDGDITNAGGDTDIQVEFPVTIQ